MAINIQQEPDDYTPAYNPVISVVSGTTEGRTNYKYIAEILFVGDSVTSYQLEVDPQSDGFGVFNFEDVTKDFVTHDLTIPVDNQEGFLTNPNSYKGFTPIYGESYGSPPEDTLGVTTGSTVYAFNGALSHNDFVDWASSGYIVSDFERKFLTLSTMTFRSPLLGNTGRRDFRIASDENAWLYIMTDTDDNAYEILIQVHDGTSATNYVLDNTNYRTVTGNPDTRFLRIPAGTRNLNKINPSDLSTGALPIIDDNTKEYSIIVRDSSQTHMTEQFVFFVKENCSPYTPYRLHFLNELGGFDSFTFYNRNERITEVERGTYRKVQGRYSSGAWSISKDERNRNNYSTIYNRKLTLHSDWITEAEGTWLEGLITSPVVYWDDNDTLIPIEVTNSEYRGGRDENGELVNLTLEVDFNNNHKRQNY